MRHCHYCGTAIKDNELDCLSCHIKHTRYPTKLTPMQQRLASFTLVLSVLTLIAVAVMLLVIVMMASK